MGEECKEEFYNDVARLLNCSRHSYKEFPFSKRSRWNNREQGNGRFPNNGIVRYYNSETIHIALTNPKLTGLYKSTADALEAIHKSIIER